MSSTTMAFAAGVGFPTPGSCFFNGTTYIVDSMLGQGTFGTVVKCTRLDTYKTVAVKLIARRPGHIESAMSEVSILEKLRQLDPDRCNLVRWHQFFFNESFTCLEFEHLDRSLANLVAERGSQPLRLAEIRLIICQVASALYYLRFMGVIHADLKLDNVMLVDHKHQPYRVKVIDFGIAQEVSAARPGTLLQSLYFRAPEILLGLPYGPAIDVWSLGIMAAVLYSGEYLYAAESEYQMLQYIEKIQGKLPDHLLNKGLKTTWFYRRDKHCPTTWRLKTPKEYFRGSQKCTSGRCRKVTNSLDDFFKVRPITSTNSMDILTEMSDIQMFVDMLKGMLQVDAEHRLTPGRVVQHHFITMGHMSLPSAYASTSREKMDACCQKTIPIGIEPPDSRPAVPSYWLPQKDDGGYKATLDLTRRPSPKGPTCSMSQQSHQPSTVLEEPKDRCTSGKGRKRKKADEPHEKRKQDKKRRYLFLDLVEFSSQSQIPSKKGTNSSVTKPPAFSSSLPSSRFTKKEDGSDKATLDLTHRPSPKGPTSSMSHQSHQASTVLEEPKDRCTRKKTRKRKKADEPHEETEQDKKRPPLSSNVMGSSSQSQIPSQKRKHNGASDTCTAQTKKSRKGD